MNSLSQVAMFQSGTSQFRIREDPHEEAPAYFFYGQSDLEEDLTGLPVSDVQRRQVRTFDSVCVATEGDVVFSLISGTAAIVQASHTGFLLTQNYIVLEPTEGLDSRYLLYLLNEHVDVRRQLRLGQQGSIVIKYTVGQLKKLELPPLPPMGRQQAIGELYCNQFRLEALRKRASELETTLVLEHIKEVVQS